MHQLDRPIWNALVSRQAALAVGNASALRFPAEFAPFAATRDDSAESLALLADIVPEAGAIAMFTTELLDTPLGLDCVTRGNAVQMILAGAPPPARAIMAPYSIRVLEERDAPAMQALAAATKPGPFSTRTHELGRFLGVFADQQLVAMAGERLLLDGFVELSGVCTDPDHRGHGLAGSLVVQLAHAAVARSDTPFLHAFAQNETALSVYRGLGFIERARLHLIVLRRAA